MWTSCSCSRTAAWRPWNSSAVHEPSCLAQLGAWWDTPSHLPARWRKGPWLALTWAVSSGNAERYERITYTMKLLLLVFSCVLSSCQTLSLFSRNFHRCESLRWSVRTRVRGHHSWSHPASPSAGHQHRGCRRRVSALLQVCETLFISLFIPKFLPAKTSPLPSRCRLCLLTQNTTKWFIALPPQCGFG